MPPLQQFPAPAAPEQPEKSPYDFFMEPQAPQKKSFGGKKLLLLVAGLVVLVIMGIVVAASLLGGNKDTAPELAVAQTQAEIIRLATDGTRNARAGALQNFAFTASVSLTSAQQEYLALLARHGIKVKAEQLTLGKNAQSDQALAAAQSSNTYDTTFSSIMKTELDKYEARLAVVYAKATTIKDKTTLKKHLDGAALLERQLLAQ